LENIFIINYYYLSYFIIKNNDDIIRISSNDKLICLKYKDKIIIFSAELECFIVSLDVNNGNVWKKKNQNFTILSSFINYYFFFI
jgi:hypothetical protein